MSTTSSAKLDTMGLHRFGAVTARVAGAATVAVAALVVYAAYGDPNAKWGQKDAVPFLVLVAAIAGDPCFPASVGCRTPRHVAWLGGSSPSFEPAPTHSNLQLRSDRHSRLCRR
jgi:hypothetical protein